MKAALRLTFFLILFFLPASCSKENFDTGEIFFADPTIFAENDRYYLTGTSNIEPLGFRLLESDDLLTWGVPSEDSICMILEKGRSTFGEKGFWAPQLLHEKGAYYLSYTANEQTVLSASASLKGPYIQEKIGPIDGSEKNIDSYVFRDDDGKVYLYHVRFNRGNYLWVAEFDLESGTIDPTTLTKCFDATEDWEATPNYESAPIMEGPTVLKMKGKYYLFYSANHFRNIDYAVGYATSDSPYGPWVKHENNPIIHRSIVGENGSGHGDIFEDGDGQLHYVYHVHHSDSVVTPRRTRIVPLHLEWNGQTGVYDFSIDPGEIIVPLVIKK